MQMVGKRRERGARGRATEKGGGLQYRKAVTLGRRQAAFE